MPEKITYLENNNFEVEKIVPEQVVKNRYNLDWLKTRQTLLAVKMANLNKEIDKITEEQAKIADLIPKLEALIPIKPIEEIIKEEE